MYNINVCVCVHEHLLGYSLVLCHESVSLGGHSYFQMQNRSNPIVSPSFVHTVGCVAKGAHSLCNQQVLDREA